MRLLPPALTLLATLLLAACATPASDAESGAGAGQDAHRSAQRLGDLALLGVERFEQRNNSCEVVVVRGVRHPFRHPRRRRGHSIP